MSPASLLLPYMNLSFRMKECSFTPVSEAPGKVWHVKNLPFCMGKSAAPCISSHSLTTLSFPLSKSKFSTPEDYFLCRNNSLDFTCCLRTSPSSGKLLAQWGPYLPLPSTMCFYLGCLHQEDSSGAARRPWLAEESHNGKTWLLSWLDMISLLPLCSTQIPLHSEVTDETSYNLLLLICFIKGGPSQIPSKQSDYIFYDSIWVTWYLCSRPSKASPVTCSCSKPHFLSGKMYGH